MPRFSQSVLSYTDIHQVFEAAGVSGPINLEFATTAEAVVFVGRANAYRVLLRKQNEAAGRDFSSPFDHLVVSRPKESLTVTVRPRGFNFRAVTASGEELNLSQQTLSGPAPLPHEITAIETEAEDFLAEYEAELKGKAE